MMKKKLLIDRNRATKAIQRGVFDWSTSVLPMFCGNLRNALPKNKLSVFWGGDEQRDAAVYIGAAIVDHPQLDKLTGCPGAVIHCNSV